MDEIREAISYLLEIENPMTARQVFYRLVSDGVIEKTEQEYKGTVVRLLGEMRLAGEIRFEWIADNTRWMRKPRTFDSAEEALRITAEAYRRSVWTSQDAYVEIWLEKDALAGVLLDVTAPWDVPLMVTRGYASLSFLHSAAETIAETWKETFIYLLSDFDPSGVDLARNVERRLREFAPDADLTFERIAVTEEQIADWDLRRDRQRRPTAEAATSAAGASRSTRSRRRYFASSSRTRSSSTSTSISIAGLKALRKASGVCSCGSRIGACLDLSPRSGVPSGACCDSTAASSSTGINAPGPRAGGGVAVLGGLRADRSPMMGTSAVNETARVVLADVEDMAAVTSRFANELEEGAHVEGDGEQAAYWRGCRHSANVLANYAEEARLRIDAREDGARQ